MTSHLLNLRYHLASWAFWNILAKKVTYATTWLHSFTLSFIWIMWVLVAESQYVCCSTAYNLHWQLNGSSVASISSGPFCCTQWNLVRHWKEGTNHWWPMLWFTIMLRRVAMLVESIVVCGQLPTTASNDTIPRADDLSLGQAESPPLI